MSEQSTGEKKNDLASEGLGLADQFVQTLGLVDIIIGALFLYWVRLVFPDVMEVLDSTGFVWVDIALLACAAACIGKVISTVVEYLAAFMDSRRDENEGELKRLVDALTLYRDKIQDQSELSPDVDKIDLAATYVSNSSPEVQNILDQTYNATTIAYSMAVLSFLFSYYFFSKLRGPLIVLGIGQGVVAIVLIILGSLKQNDYLDTVADNLLFITSKLNLEKERHDVENRKFADPVILQMSSSPQSPIELVVKIPGIIIANTPEEKK